MDKIQASLIYKKLIIVLLLSGSFAKMRANRVTEFVGDLFWSQMNASELDLKRTEVKFNKAINELRQLLDELQKQENARENQLQESLRNIQNRLDALEKNVN